MKGSVQSRLDLKPWRVLRFISLRSFINMHMASNSLLSPLWSSQSVSLYSDLGAFSFFNSFRSHSFAPLGTMHYLSIFIFLQAFTFVNSLPGHLHGREEKLVQGQAKKPDDILAIGKQSATPPPQASSNTGIYKSALETEGEKSVIPYATSIPSATSTIKLSGSQKIPLVVAPTQTVVASDIFDAPVSVAKPASVIGSQPDHPVPRKGIVRSNGS